jgi:dipeptidyl aminopeptidase/acylaminoacyl peptidase
MRTIRRRHAALSPARTTAGTGTRSAPHGAWRARWAQWPRRARLVPLALLAGVVVPAALGRAAGRAAEPARRPIAETDLFRFVWVADPQISRDGRRIAFVRVTVDAKHDGYETALWIVDADADAAGTGAGGAAGPRPLTAGPRDTNPRWSPDGRRLAFLRHAGKEDQLFVLPLDGGEARQLTDLPGGAKAPAWSPDGRTLAFLSATSAADLAKPGARGKEAAEAQPGPPASGAGATGLGAAAARANGGDATGLGGAAVAGGAAGTVGTAAPGAAPAGANAAAREDSLPEHQSDVRVISRAVYRFNGAGYVDPAHPDHLWTVEVPEGAAAAPPPRQLTRGEFDEQAPAWAPDGSRLYVVSDRVKEPYYQDAAEAIYAVPAAGGELVKVASFTGGISSLAVSPDGRQIAFIGATVAKPVRSYDQPDLWVVASAPGGEPRNLTAAFDFDIGAHLIGDQHPPRGAGRDVPAWSADGSSLLVPAEERGRVELRRFEIQDGRSRPVTAGDHEVMSFSAVAAPPVANRDTPRSSAPDGSRLALVISTPTAIGDLFALDLPAAAAAGAVGTGDAGAVGTTAAVSVVPLRQLTHFNDALFARLTLTPPQAITYRSFDGREIEAWVQRPPGYPAGKPYPMILDIHGGPHGAYGYTFFHETQWMAAKGYVVIYPNPRGSTAYGQEFGNVIQYRYPGDDFKDLMAGVDELVRRGDADPKRLGVTGGSGGGLLTNWTITQTDRFAAAVSQRSIADWAGWWYTADFTLFTPRWFRGAPFEEQQDFVARSPITFVKNVKTPLMLIEGEADYRTPPTAGGEAMFRALKYLRRPVVMVRFPGESHELSRSGHPWHRVERLQHIVRWFDKYLKGEKTDLYDVP